MYFYFPFTGDAFVNKRFLVAPEFLDKLLLLFDDAVYLGTLGVEVGGYFLLLVITRACAIHAAEVLLRNILHTAACAYS